MRALFILSLIGIAVSDIVLPEPKLSPKFLAVNKKLWSLFKIIENEVSQLDLPRPVSNEVDTDALYDVLSADEYIEEFDFEDSEDNDDDDHENDIDLLKDDVKMEPRFILSWQIRRYIRKARKQMPCGWPDYGIPPLAPVRVTEQELAFKRGVFESINRVLHFKIDGLDNFKIKEFKLNILKKRITFDFLFKNIATNAENFDTKTLFDALNILGFSVQYEGVGSFNLEMINLRVAGVLKYKLPLLWGSAKITSLKTTIGLEQFKSEIKNVIGNGRLNVAFNRILENMIVRGINDNEQLISDVIEDNVVPRVNKMLKGYDFWTVVDLILSKIRDDDEEENDPIITKCVPPPDPWA